MRKCQILYAEIFYRVVVANISYHFADEFYIFRHLAVFDKSAEIRAKYSPEIVVAGIG